MLLQSCVEHCHQMICPIQINSTVGNESAENLFLKKPCRTMMKAVCCKFISFPSADSCPISLSVITQLTNLLKLELVYSVAKLNARAPWSTSLSCLQQSNNSQVIAALHSFRFSFAPLCTGKSELGFALVYFGCLTKTINQRYSGKGTCKSFGIASQQYEAMMEKYHSSRPK